MSLYSSSLGSKEEKESENIPKKKSILVTRARQEQRGSSKSSIHWKPTVKQQSEETISIPTVSRYPSLAMLVTEDSKWKYVQDFTQKLRMEARIPLEYEVSAMSKKGVENLVKDLGLPILWGQKEKGPLLTQEQEDGIDRLKSKIKLDNDEYLLEHPELGVLIQLIYRMLFKDKPDDPKLAIAKYVHYLNTHREEMVLEEVDVPFDKPRPTEETSSSVDSERKKIAVFARRLVEKCANIASHGKGYVDVTSIIESMLKMVSPSEDSISEDSSLTSEEEDIEDILMSLLNSVIVAKTPTSEIVVDEILMTILDNVNPSVREDSVTVLETRQSIEQFIKSLVKNLSRKVLKKVVSRDALKKGTKKSTEYTEGIDDTLMKQTTGLKIEPSRPILKIPTMDDKSDIYYMEHPRVKFQSIPHGQQ